MVAAGEIPRENAYGSPESELAVGMRDTMPFPIDAGPGALAIPAFVSPTDPVPGIGAWNHVTPGEGIADQIGEIDPNIGSAM